MSALDINTEDLIVFSSRRWEAASLRTRQLTSRFAKERRVFVVEIPRFTEEWEDARIEVFDDASGVRVAVPRLSKPMASGHCAAAAAALVDDLLERERLRDFTCWYESPEAVAFTRHLEPAVVVYDCTEAYSLFEGAAPSTVRLEAELLRRADAVFTSKSALAASKRGLNRNVHSLHGVSVDDGLRKARGGLLDPCDQKPLTRPRVGFAGTVDPALDLALLDEVARLRPHWNFVVAGPITGVDPASLPKWSNIRYLGRKDPAQLPCYYANWDVVMMPFAAGETAGGIGFDGAIHALAAGCPVVATPAPEFAETLGERGLIRIAAGARGFVAAAERALSEKHDAARLEKVDRLLAEFSWDGVWAEMARIENAARSRRLRPRLERHRSEHLPFG